MGVRREGNMLLIGEVECPFTQCKDVAPHAATIPLLLLLFIFLSWKYFVINFTITITIIVKVVKGSAPQPHCHLLVIQDNVVDCFYHLRYYYYYC